MYCNDPNKGVVSTLKNVLPFFSSAASYFSDRVRRGTARQGKYSYFMIISLFEILKVSSILSGCTVDGDEGNIYIINIF